LVIEVYYGNRNDKLSKMFAIDYKTDLVDDILVKVDRATMSTSLEGREPLLDYRLVEYISQLPIELKLGEKGNKFLLKEIVHKYVPREIMDRPKMGFGIPLSNWFRTELKFYLDNYLNVDRIQKQGIFQSDFVHKLVIEYYNGRNDDFELIWFLLIFQLWYDEWM